MNQPPTPFPPLPPDVQKALNGGVPILNQPNVKLAIIYGPNRCDLELPVSDYQQLVAMAEKGTGIVNIPLSGTNTVLHIPVHAICAVIQNPPPVEPVEPAQLLHPGS